eukprot:COSAG02_NODE_2374_length_9019_cov_784.726121_11_plen_67_part_00
MYCNRYRSSRLTASQLSFDAAECSAVAPLPFARFGSMPPPRSHEISSSLFLAAAQCNAELPMPGWR